MIPQPEDFGRIQFLQALLVVTRQWYAAREQLADAQRAVADAECDLRELARQLEAMSPGVVPARSQVLPTMPAPAGVPNAVTMPVAGSATQVTTPIVAPTPVTNNGQIDAAEEVLRIMKAEAAALGGGV